VERAASARARTVCGKELDSLTFLSLARVLLPSLIVPEVRTEVKTMQVPIARGEAAKLIHELSVDRME
jgi:hypothetical protein